MYFKIRIFYGIFTLNFFSLKSLTFCFVSRILLGSYINCSHFHCVTVREWMPWMQEKCLQRFLCQRFHLSWEQWDSTHLNKRLVINYQIVSYKSPRVLHYGRMERWRRGGWGLMKVKFLYLFKSACKINIWSPGLVYLKEYLWIFLVIIIIDCTSSAVNTSSFSFLGRRQCVGCWVSLSPAFNHLTW